MKFFTFIIAYIKALSRKHWDRHKIEKHQAKRIKKITAYAKKQSPYFAKIYNGEKHFEDLPILSKKEMMEHFSSYNTRGVSKEQAFEIAIESEDDRSFEAKIHDISIGLSSGTSGNRGIFLTSSKEQALWAGTILAKTLPRSILHNTSIGLFLRANNQLYETLKSKKIEFQYYDLQKPFSVLLDQYEKKRPKIVVAPPSALILLAKGKVNHIPEKIYSCAEVLDPLDKKGLSKYFGQTIHQIYQCTEGLLATTCEHGTLHVNEDIIYLEKEALDQNSKRFVPIITDLYRTTQPILRYRLDDILIEKSSPCPCGSHYLALEKIEGRCDDILYFLDHMGKRVTLFPDFLRRKIISFDENIVEYQVIQHSETELDIYTSPPNPEVIPYLETYFTRLGFQSPAMTLLDKPLPRKQEDKLRRIVRKCP